MRRFWRAETGLFVGLWLLLMVAGRSRLFQDPGTFWHTAVGREILSSGSLPGADQFSFTFKDQPWIAHQWLGECLMAWVYGWGGYDALLLGTVTLLAGFYTWIGQRLLRSGLTWMPTVLCLAVVLAASAHHFHVRPHLATIVFLGMTFALLCDVEAGRAWLRRMYWLAPVFFLWTNMHGGALAGLATVMVVLAGWCGLECLGRAKLPGRAKLLLSRIRLPARQEPRPPIADSARQEPRPPISAEHSPIRRPAYLVMPVNAVLGCCLAMLWNPYGWRIPQTWLRIMSLDLPELIEEHAPLDLHRPEGWMVMLLGVGYLVALSGLRRWPRATWLIPLLYFVLACDRIRHAPLLAVVTAIALADLLPHTRWAAWFAMRGLFRFPETDSREAAMCREAEVSARPLAACGRAEASPSRVHWRAAVIPLLLVFAALSCQALAVPLPVLGHGWATLDPAVWPLEMLPELQPGHEPLIPRTRIFNSLNLGGFLILHAPVTEIFIDDRCELYGGDFLRQYVEAERHDPAQIDRWAETYGFQLALVTSGSPFDRYLETADDWSLVRRTTAASLYRRMPSHLSEG